jgi:hypothetical protein
MSPETHCTLAGYRKPDTGAPRPTARTAFLLCRSPIPTYVLVRIFFISPSKRISLFSVQTVLVVWSAGGFRRDNLGRNSGGYSIRQWQWRILMTLGRRWGRRRDKRCVTFMGHSLSMPCQLLGGGWFGLILWRANVNKVNVEAGDRSD